MFKVQYVIPSDKDLYEFPEWYNNFVYEFYPKCIDSYWSDYAESLGYFTYFEDMLQFESEEAATAFILKWS